MTRRISAWILAVPLLALLSWPALADVTIAVAGPMTGKDAAFGNQMRVGAAQAVADINAAGGVLGQKLVLEVADDACDPKQAVAVANRLAGQGVKAVFGHFCSGSSIPASEVYHEENIIQITPGSTNPALTEAGKANVFRVCGRDDQQGPAAATFIAERFMGQRIAIVHDKTAYGKGLADEMKKALNRLGVKEVLLETITPGEKDYSALVGKMNAADIGVVYLGGYYTEAGLIVRQMRERGMKTVLVSGDALADNAYWTIAGEQGAGTLFSFGPDPRKIANAAPVVKSFRDKQIEPEGYVLYTYAAIQAWAQAATKAGSFDAAKVIPVLHATRFDTVLGPISFDAKGDVVGAEYVFYEWKDGKYDYAR